MPCSLDCGVVRGRSLHDHCRAVAGKTPRLKLTGAIARSGRGPDHEDQFDQAQRRCGGAGRARLVPVGQPGVGFRVRLCRNTCCFVRVTGLWVWMIYRGCDLRFVDLFGSRGLKGRDLRFPAAILPDRGANGSRRAPRLRSSPRSAG